MKQDPLEALFKTFRRAIAIIACSLEQPLKLVNEMSEADIQDLVAISNSLSTAL
jgi:hypothetical protein